MKTRLSSRPDATNERRSTTIGQAAVLKPASTSVMPDVRSSSLVQLQEKARISRQAVQLKARADIMSRGSSDAPVQRVDDHTPQQGEFSVVQRRKLNGDEVEEVRNLKVDFEGLNTCYHEKMAEIERILAIVTPVPLSSRYLANRMDSTLRPLADFLEKSIALADLAPSSSRQLSRLQSRNLWYRKNSSAKELLEQTLKQAEGLEPSLNDMVEQANYHVETMGNRRTNYIADWRSTLTKAEIRKAHDGVSGIDSVTTDAIRDDPENSVGTVDWKEVSDSGAPSKEKTKFYNMFHSQAIVMLENYRDRSKNYFASDAVFDQWARATGVESLLELPTSFPRYFYRNHIDNKAARAEAERLLGEKDSIWVNFGSPDWKRLAVTDNVKSTMNILADYNKINIARHEAQFACEGMLIYKGPTLKFIFNPA